MAIMVSVRLRYTDCDYPFGFFKLFLACCLLLLCCRSECTNIVDAAAKGAQDAMYVVLTVVACLISFLSILAFLNAVLIYLGSLVGIENLSFDVSTMYL